MKGHDSSKNVHSLINTFVWKQAIVAMYQRNLIKQGAVGMVRNRLEEILDGYCIAMLKPCFPSGTVNTAKFIW